MKPNTKLPKVCNNPLKMLELYKENNKIQTNKEELEKEMNSLCEKETLILGIKEQLTARGAKKKLRGELIVQKRRMHDHPELALKHSHHAIFFKIAAHIMYSELL